MLTIDNFEGQLDKNTLQKGRSYFTKKAVLYLEPTSDTLWKAEVEGTEVYSVEIQLEGRTLTDTFCDCPVEAPLCKHTVAVLLALREKLSQPKAKTRKTPKKLTIEDLLLKVTADELRQFVAGYAASDKGFASKVQLHFADKDERIDIGKQYTELVRKAIKAQSSRGFVEYRSSAKLAKEVNQILAMGHRFFTQQNFRDALTVSRVVLIEMLKVLDNSDDSGGHLGHTVSSTIGLLRQLAESDETAQSLRDSLFDFLAAELQRDVYFGYSDFGHQLLHTAFGLALKLNEPERFLALIDQLLPIHQSDYGDYTPNLLRTTQIRFLKAVHQMEQARELTQAHLDIVEVRKDAVSEAIEHLNYELAKELIREGIQLAEAKKHPGTVRQWQEYLLTIAYMERDVPTIRHWTKTFAFDRGQGITLAYYQQWKQSFPAEEWAIAYESLIRQLTEKAEQDARPQRAAWFFETEMLFYQLGPIYVEEQQWNALLDLVAQQPSLERLEKTHTHLVSRFPTEMLALYLPVLEKLGQKAGDRSDYRHLAELIGLIKRDIPASVPVMNALIQQLKERNPRRPAFLEELNAIQ